MSILIPLFKCHKHEDIGWKRFSDDPFCPLSMLLQWKKKCHLRNFCNVLIKKKGRIKCNTRIVDCFSLSNNSKLKWQKLLSPMTNMSVLTEFGNRKLSNFDFLPDKLVAKFVIWGWSSKGRTVQPSSLTYLRPPILSTVSFYKKTMIKFLKMRQCIWYLQEQTLNSKIYSCLLYTM